MEPSLQSKFDNGKIGFGKRGRSNKIERWRCLLLSESNFKDIIISLPQQLLNEVDGVMQQEEVNRNELIHQATKMYLRDRKKRQIRESMRQGYMEMAKINLNMASEAFLAEEEAENTLDRLVGGV